MARVKPEIIQTTLSDRDVLLHILTHVEDLTGQVQALVDALEEFRPLLNLVKGRNGKPDYVGIAQVGRGMRRAGLRGP